MSLKQQVDDALFLAEHDRHIGALTMLLIAIGGSSRKVFPLGVMSRKEPRRQMGDGEAFELFLGDRLAQLLKLNPPEDAGRASGILVEFGGERPQLEHILYKLYRCALVHESELAPEVEFRPSDEPGVSITGGDKMILGRQWITVLANAITHATCNGKEFGIRHFRLRLRPGVDEATFASAAITQWDITQGRYDLLKQALLRVTPERVAGVDDDTLRREFHDLYLAGQLRWLPAMGRGLSDFDGRLLPAGAALLRHMASAYVTVEL